MNTYSEQLSNIIKDKDLYGRSFTLGVALYIGIKEKMVTFGLMEAFEDMCCEYFYDIAKMLEQYRMHQGARVWAEMLDIAMLDDMARELTGENDDEEE